MLTCVACSRTPTPESKPTPTVTAPPPRTATATAIAAVPSASASSATPAVGTSPAGVVIRTPAPGETPSDDIITPEDVDFEWNLLDEADGPDFDIDADATAYLMPYANTVTFKAKALNGSPPFTFTWDFGDGTPLKTGEIVKHTFRRIGNFEVWCHGKDANREEAHVNLKVGVVMPETYVNFLQLDPEKLKSLPTPPPEDIPTPTATP